ncbi:hypothetical protein HMPREF0063_10293 [Aeromicrobium marinum DSM 15272]|uniref:Uncharacterized protein n=1 Tax=Aeromicrobium marinum DSM 15272 TaxID=585531 RepID=E2S8D6_9ACTN|nr:hypothetical protein [Aeromicrobium marinum]EFQ84441.1 hypothetical protein HMPREF0063_10293 [Aeromicrobium marinum DSM 15272]
MGSVRFTDDQVATFGTRARDDLRRSAESGSRLITDQRRRLAEFERHQQKLLDAYMADALPVEVLKDRQGSVATEITEVNASSRVPRPTAMRSSLGSSRSPTS